MINKIKLREHWYNLLVPETDLSHVLEIIERYQVPGTMIGKNSVGNRDYSVDITFMYTARTPEFIRDLMDEFDGVDIARSNLKRIPHAA